MLGVASACDAERDPPKEPPGTSGRDAVPRDRVCINFVTTL